MADFIAQKIEATLPAGVGGVAFAVFEGATKRLNSGVMGTKYQDLVGSVWRSALDRVGGEDLEELSSNEECYPLKYLIEDAIDKHLI